MSREPMRVGRESTEPVNPITGLTLTETRWLITAQHDVKELNKLLWERGSKIRFRVSQEG